MTFDEIKNKIILIKKIKLPWFKKYYDIEEIARLLNCTNSDVCSLVYNNKLKIVEHITKTGWGYYVTKKDLLKFLKNHTINYH